MKDLHCTNNKNTFYRYHLPVFISIFGGFFILILIITNLDSNPYAIGLGIIPIFGGIGAFFVVNNYNNRLSINYEIPQFQKKILFISYLLTVIIFLLSYHKSAQIFSWMEKSFLLILYIMTLTIVILIQSLTQKFFFVFATSILHRFSLYFSSPFLFGPDSMFHARISHEISLSGSLIPLEEALSKYLTSPLFHILGGTGSLILDLSVKNAIFFEISVMLIIVGGLIVFIITSSLWDENVGLISMIVFLTSDASLRWTLEPGSTTLGLIIFSLIFHSLFKFTEFRIRRHYALIILYFAVLFLVHQLSLVIGFIFLIVYLFVMRISQRKIFLMDIILIIYATVLTIFEMIITKVHISETNTNVNLMEFVFQLLFSQIMKRGISERGEFILPEFLNISAQGADSLSLIHTMGFTLILTFALIGILNELTYPNSTNNIGYSIALSAISFMIFMFGLPLFGVTVIQSNRWFPFLYVITSIFSGFGIILVGIYISNYIDKDRIYIIVIIIILISQIIFMGGNFSGSKNDPIFDQAPGAYRYELTEQEVKTVKFVNEYTGDTNIYGEFLPIMVLQNHYGLNSKVTLAILNDQNQQLIINRPALYIYRNYASTDHGLYRLKIQNRWFLVHGTVPIVKRTLRNKIYNAQRPNGSVYFVG